MTEPERIVRALAAIEDPTVCDTTYAPSAECGLCRAVDDEYRHALDDPSQHAPTCPWRLAVEWARAGTGEAIDPALALSIVRKIAAKKGNGGWVDTETGSIDVHIRLTAAEADLVARLSTPG